MEDPSLADIVEKATKIPLTDWRYGEGTPKIYKYASKNSYNRKFWEQNVTITAKLRAEICIFEIRSHREVEEGTLTQREYEVHLILPFDKGASYRVKLPSEDEHITLRRLVKSVEEEKKK